jgi:fused signal recognition particle receptor
MVETLLLILVAVVLVFGIGVVVLNRRRGREAGGAGIASGPVAAEVPPAELGTRTAGGLEAEWEAELEAEVHAGSELLEEPVVGGDHPSSTAAETSEVLERPTFRGRLAKARAALAGAITGIRGRAGITQETLDDLEEALLRADVGVIVSDLLLEDLRARVKAKEIADPDRLLEALRADMKARLAGADRSLRFETGGPGAPNVWLFVGVNGVGKTTTIGKVAAQQVADGRSVLLAAGDTFRAAAAEQLTTWGERAGAEVVRGNEGGDPASVVFDAVQRAAARDIDLVLADTAGRLHNKANLMQELRKVRRVADREPGRVTETLLVIDATTGQNGLAQAREFGEATDVTGVVLTKLDGSAKGGIVFAIETALGIPVKLVGLGETIGDLVPFDPDEFVDALFDD